MLYQIVQMEKGEITKKFLEVYNTKREAKEWIKKEAGKEGFNPKKLKVLEVENILDTL